MSNKTSLRQEKPFPRSLWTSEICSGFNGFTILNPTCPQDPNSCFQIKILGKATVIWREIIYHSLLLLNRGDNTSFAVSHVPFVCVVNFLKLGG